jgi:hypothetical protein
MADVLFVVASIAMFAALIVFVGGCDRLIRRQG